MERDRIKAIYNYGCEQVEQQVEWKIRLKVIYRFMGWTLVSEQIIDDMRW